MINANTITLAIRDHIPLIILLELLGIIFISIGYKEKWDIIDKYGRVILGFLSWIFFIELLIFLYPYSIRYF